MKKKNIPEKENYVSLSIHMRYNIAVEATDEEIIKTLNLEFHVEGIWEKTTRYVYSHWENYSIKKRMDTRYVVTSPPLNNWRLLSFINLNSYSEGIAMCQKLSSQFGTTCLFYKDDYIDFGGWCSCHQGTVLYIITRNGEEVEIKGMLGKVEKEFIEKHNYFTWDMEQFLSSNYFNINKLYPPNELYKMKSKVCIAKRHFNEYDYSNLPTEIINIWDEKYIEDMPNKHEGLSDELPF